MRSLVTFSLALALWSLGGLPTAVADEPVASVKGVLMSYVDAFNQGDVDALAAKWAPDAVWCDDQTGDRVEGREAIAAGFARFLTENPQARLSGKVDHARLVSPAVAAFEGTSILLVPGDEPLTRTFSAILVNQDGKWLLSSVHESLPPSGGAPADHLRQLEFLIGTWIDQSDEANVRTTARWGAANSFIVRSYVVETADQEGRQGTQVIGWDPRENRIRSWSFESDGSFGEATWSRDGQDWLARMHHVMLDGGVASATQVIRAIDKDTLEVETLAIEVDGQPVPGGSPVRVVREAGDQQATQAVEESAATRVNPAN